MLKVQPELLLDVVNPEAKATWWAQDTHGVTYVRCSMPAKHLPGQVIRLQEGDIKLGPLNDAIWTRSKGAQIWPFAGNNTRAVLMAEAINQGIPAYLEVDDDYTRPPDLQRISAWKHRYTGTDEHSYEVCTWIARFASGVIVSTPTLADVYSKLNDNVHLCTNCVDPDDWDELDRPDDGILRIGWAGSDSHQKDARLLKQAIRWLVGRPNVEVIIIGVNIASFPSGVIRVPWLDSLAAYRKSLQMLDVMLCPLRRTDWSDAKSDLKALEAGMGGAMSVVSDSPAYEPWHDRTMVCATENDWEKAVKHLYKNRDEVKQLQKEHRKYVLRERTIQRGISQWHEALGTTSISSPIPTTSSQSVESPAAMLS